MNCSGTGVSSGCSSPSERETMFTSEHPAVIKDVFARFFLGT